MAGELPPARVVRGVRPLTLHTPPRRVPLRLWAQLYLGRVAMQFGFLWLAGLAWFAVAVLPQGRWNRTFDGHATGTVQSIVSSGGEDPDLEAHFVFRDAAGREHTNHSLIGSGDVEVNGHYDVAYVSREPDYAELRVPGLRSRYSSLGFDLVMIGAFALVGLLVCIADALAARRDVRLLRRGRETTAVLVDKRREEIGDGVVTILTFEYEANGKTERFQYQPSGSTAHLEDDRDEPIVYDPKVPSRFTPLDDLPGRPVIEGGELRARRTFIAHLFVLPVASLAPIATLLVLWYR